ncbi:head GIN domain-containing protein [Pseudotenacibaculum sp. MALMAid0570]|uniref:head GIN domain-containing protein n=1 Tax=Pseudotenacibaculum sp. MALMAid0570 TaxID=3143938 RepID=UPI0032E0469F
MRKLIITAFILTITFSVDAQNWWGNKKVRGNGNVTTVTRNTGSYDGVSVGGFFDVILVKGTEGKVKIEGEENLMEYIVTEVKKGTLKIKVEKGVNLKTTRRLTVTVPVKDIDHVSLGGSGNVKSETLLKAEDFGVSLGGSGNITLEVDATNVKSSIGGSGNIKLTGKADYMKSSIAGSGTIKAYELQVNSIKASIAGSGDIRISVKDEIKATVAGSGSIYYKGNPPKIDTKSVGSGSVRSRN